MDMMVKKINEIRNAIFCNGFHAHMLVVAISSCSIPGFSIFRLTGFSKIFIAIIEQVMVYKTRFFYAEPRMTHPAGIFSEFFPTPHKWNLYFYSILIR